MKPQTRRPRLIAPLAVASLAAAAAAAGQTAVLHTVTRSVSYPVAIATGPVSPQGHTMLYIAERLGTVRLVDTVSGAAALALTVANPIYANGDAGLQCVAPSPDGLFLYVYYNTSATTAVLERQTLSPDRTHALAGTAQTVLRYQRPEGHNGGWIGFSPVDGDLYLSLGDGGNAANPDPTNAAQSLTGPNVFQGKVLRLDPTGDDFPANPDRNYRIPPGNPFVGRDGDDEVWDYGLRNPWRCAFDLANGDFWIADVGQETYEEIDIERAGTPGALGGNNYGWKCYEGPLYTGYAPCTATLPFTPPAYVYDHGPDGGCSITGGVVSRDGSLPALNGSYLFSDFCTTAVWALRTGAGAPVRTTVVAAGTATLEGETVGAIVAFGTDAAGRACLADYFNGRVYALQPISCAADLGGTGGVPTPDGQLDSNDFIVYIDDFFTGDPRADLGRTGGIAGADGALDNNDFIVYIDLFFTGC